MTSIVAILAVVNLALLVIIFAGQLLALGYLRGAARARRGDPPTLLDRLLP